MSSGGVRTRLGLAFSSLALVMFGITGWLSAETARRQAEADAALALQALADRLALQLDADMAARLHEIEQLATLPGQFGVAPDAPAWRELFERLQRTGLPYSWIGLADPMGSVVASTGGLLQGRDVSSRPWFSKGSTGPAVLELHEAVMLARLLPPETSGEPTRFVDVTAPLRDARGRLQGVIGAHLSWRWAEARRREALTLAQAHAGVDIVVVDHAGTPVLGPRQAMTGGLLPAGVQTLRWSDGVLYLSAASRSQPRAGYPGMAWTVVVRQPADKALAAASAVQRRVWLLGLVGATVFGALGWWLSGRLTAPLRRLAARVQALRPWLAPADEVEALATAIDRLLDELHANERALQAANQSLESRVAERTASLQRANDDLREFSRSVSHDLRGPLGGMAMMLRQQLARPQALMDTETRGKLELLSAEADRLRQLTEELLTLAMVEQRELAVAPVDHAALVREVLEGLRTATPGWRGEVAIDPLPVLQGDALMLRQVWANLLSNAMKFSARTPGPRIEVGATPGAGGVMFSVIDNGAGFDATQSARLFGVFQRLHRSSEYPGTGVGLSIVRRVVHRHGGRVWAESTPGRGASFHFVLPDMAPAEPPSAAEGQQAAPVSPC